MAVMKRTLNLVLSHARTCMSQRKSGSEAESGAFSDGKNQLGEQLLNSEW